jgi:hypothetical protein
MTVAMPMHVVARMGSRNNVNPTIATITVVPDVTTGLTTLRAIG